MHPDAFAVEPGFLDTASVGAPPVATTQALRDALTTWSLGRARPADYDTAVAAARGSFARLVNAPVDTVAIGSQASVFAGFVAASLPDGALVVGVEGDFTSILFPFLAQEHRGVTVRLVPPAGLIGALDDRVDLVTVSAVQSANGSVTNLDAVATAAAAHDIRTFIDGTQAVGWLPLDATRFDYFVCAAYKWLMSPRGTAFLTVRPERLFDVTPQAAGWYAGQDVWTSIYGGPLRLATDARRLDVSPAWLSWVGTSVSLALLESWGIDAVHRHDVGLADRLRAGLGLPEGNSAIVRIEQVGADQRLAAAGVRASSRAGAVRLSFHVYNTPADVDRVIAALA